MEPLSLSSCLLLARAGTLRVQATALPDLVAQPIDILPQELPGALAVLFLAGVSITAGESVVLFANRVSRPRFILSLITSALLLAVSVLIWAGSIWIIAQVLFDRTVPFEKLFVLVSLSYAPLILGFLVLLPYLGNLILHILNIWVFLATLGAVATVYQFPLWQALVATILGWVVLELATRLPVVNIRQIDAWLWRLSTGKSRAFGVEEIVHQYVRESRTAAEALVRERARERP